MLLCFRQFLFISTRIEFHTAYARQIVAVFTEEQAVKQLLDCFLGRRFARAHHAVNRNTCCLLINGLISAQSIGNVATLIQFINVKRSKLFYTMDIKFCQQFFSDFIIGHSQYFTRFRVNQIRGQSFANQAFRLHIQTSQSCIANITDIFCGNTFTLSNQYVAFFIQDINFGSFTFQTTYNQISLDTIFRQIERFFIVENIQDLLIVVAQSLQQNRNRHFAATVDTEIQQIFRVKFEI